MKNRQNRILTIRPHNLWDAVLFTVLSLLFLSPLQAQESRATLEGRVADRNGGMVPGVTVTVRSEQTGVKQETSTNNQGTWTVRFLNPGTYTIEISAPNFKTF